MLLYPIVVIQSGLSTPANVECAVDMGLGPFHNFTKLVPIIDLFEFQQLNRSTCDHHTVKITVSYLVEGLVKSDHVVF